MNRKLALAAASLFALAATPVLAGSQQDKMKTCNAEAKTKNLAGEERKAFMKDCLSADSGKAATQQDKMKTCNKEAGDKQLKGEERKKFMSGCLKG